MIANGVHSALFVPIVVDGALFGTIGLDATTAPRLFTADEITLAETVSNQLAVAVRTSDGTSVGLAYDLGRATAGVRHLLRNLTAIVLESNHDEVQLRTSDYPPVVQRRPCSTRGTRRLFPRFSRVALPSLK